MRQVKLGVSCELRGVRHGKWSKPCSRLHGRERDLPVGAGGGKGMSRSDPRTRFGLVKRNGSGQPARRGEASTGPEDSTMSTDGAPRGERRRRVRTETSGTWEARCSARSRGAGQPLAGSHNRRRGRSRESERPIVARKPGNAGGAKGPWPESSRVRGAGS